MQIDLVCLGVGKGATYVLHGRPSSSFVLRVNKVPYLLVDCGAGVALSYIRNIGAPFPDRMFITHNHMDHTGDLNILLGHIASENGRIPTIYGNDDVLEMVKNHRLHETTSLVPATAVAKWVTQDSSNQIQLDHGLSLELFKCQHSYLCYGFRLRQNKQLVFGYSADTGFSQEIYELATEPPVSIVDGRDVASPEHASLEEIDRFARDIPDKKLYVIHHDQTQYRFVSGNVHLLAEGMTVEISAA